MSKENTAVAEVAEMDVAMMGEMFDVKANMEGVRPEFPSVKIIHQGQMFVMPSGDKVADFEGIILDIARANAWWEVSYDDSGGGSIPDCFSMDGIVPSHDSDNIQSDDCASCPQNKFGSAGRGKACKNMKRIFIVMDGEMLPYRLTASSANIKPIDRYVTQLSSKMVPYQLVVTKFSLKQTKNQDGVEYSELEMKAVSTISDPKEAQRIKRMFDDLKPVMRGDAVKSSEIENS